MGIEIERKFIVKDLQWMPKSIVPQYLRQGYLSVTPQRTVRVRLLDAIGKITIKGESHNSVRLEYEYDIPRQEAEELLDRLCLQPQIEKNRYRVPIGPHVWEVDEFLGQNQGLIVAEVELDSVDEFVKIPDWANTEVTSDHRYSNSFLSLHPFKTW